jgi:hypothetical protein
VTQTKNSDRVGPKQPLGKTGQVTYTRSTVFQGKFHTDREGLVEPVCWCCRFDPAGGGDAATPEELDELMHTIGSDKRRYESMGAWKHRKVWTTLPLRARTQKLWCAPGPSALNDRARCPAVEAYTVCLARLPANSRASHSFCHHSLAATALTACSNAAPGIIDADSILARTSSLPAFGPWRM